VKCNRCLIRMRKFIKQLGNDLLISALSVLCCPELLSHSFIMEDSILLKIFSSIWFITRSIVKTMTLLGQEVKALIKV
jgi:hypothetical protein